MEEGLRSILLSPAAALSVLVGAFHTCLYLVLRGRMGLHLVFVLPAAVIGAWVGQAAGDRLGDVLRVGDYSLLWASAFCWLAIGLVVLVSHVGAAGKPTPPTGPGQGDGT